MKEGQTLGYGKEKYREMLSEAAETVLGYFGFDRLHMVSISEREIGIGGVHYMRSVKEISTQRECEDYFLFLETCVSNHPINLCCENRSAIIIGSVGKGLPFALIAFEYLQQSLS